MLLIKYGSANFELIVATIATPLLSITFSIHWLMGKYVEQVTFWEYISLLVITLSAILFRVFESKRIKTEMITLQEKSVE